MTKGFSKYKSYKCTFKQKESATARILPSFSRIYCSPNIILLDLEWCPRLNKLSILNIQINIFLTQGKKSRLKKKSYKNDCVNSGANKILITEVMQHMVILVPNSNTCVYVPALNYQLIKTQVSVLVVEAIPQWHTFCHALCN